MTIQSLKESEKAHLLKVLGQTHGDLEKTARLLKISLARLKSKMKAHDLGQPGPEGPLTQDQQQSKGERE